MNSTGSMIYGFAWDLYTFPPRPDLPTTWNANGSVQDGPFAPGAASGGISASSTDDRVLLGTFGPGQGPAGVYRRVDGVWQSVLVSSGQVWYGGSVLNRDGSVVAGTISQSSAPSEYAGFRWTPTGGLQPIGRPTGMTRYSPAGISDDGAVIVGTGQTGSFPSEQRVATVWRAGSGFETLSSPGTALTAPASALCISGDGLIVGGGLDAPGVITAALWTPAGRIDLNQFLQNAGLDTSTFRFQNVFCMNREATILGGGGRRLVNGQWIDAGFIVSNVTIPRCDGIDFNRNGVFPEDQDVIDFFNVLAGAPCPTCNDIDFNNNTVFPEDQDVIDFFNVLAGGAC
jgi:hypothetical protein